VRRLEFEGRFDESPTGLYAELTDGGYRRADSPHEIEAAEQREQILHVWDGRMTVKGIVAALKSNGITIGDGTIRKRIEELIADGAVVQLDEKDGKAFLYARRISQAA
jgi:hypothetical protein